MIILLEPHAETESFERTLRAMGYSVQTLKAETDTLLYIEGDTTSLEAKALTSMDGIKEVLRTRPAYKHIERADFSLSSLGIAPPLIIGGPCSVESEAHIRQMACAVNNAGANALRGGAFKPRSSPHSFQGLGEEGIKYLHKAARDHGLLSVSEILDKEDLPLFDTNIDIIQVGARNMQNFPLLKALGRTQKPVLLKRGFSNTTEEWLMSAEYILSHGNPNIILCERGIRTFEPSTRATLDLGGLLMAKKRTSLPIIADPSHAAGDHSIVEGLAKAAVAAGADGVIIEIHDDPARAKSDGAQSLKAHKFAPLVETLQKLFT